MTLSMLDIKPYFRIQVLFENETDKPTKEFKAGDLAEPTFDALSDKVFAMAHPNEDANDFMITLDYHIEGTQESRWVRFESTEALGYAIESNKHKGYVFIKATIVKKVAARPSSIPPFLGSGCTAPVFIPLHASGRTAPAFIPFASQRSHLNRRRPCGRPIRQMTKVAKSKVAKKSFLLKDETVSPPDNPIDGGWPNGWKKVMVVRKNGVTKGCVDSYWISPKGYKYRSMKQVKIFIDILNQIDGDEDKAFILFKGKI